MGKPKKNTNDEKGQCKISSFFSNPPAKKQENKSPLFSVVSTSSKLSSLSKAASVPAVRNDDVVIIDNSPVAEKRTKQDSCMQSNGVRKSATSLEFKNCEKLKIESKDSALTKVSSVQSTKDEIDTSRGNTKAVSEKLCIPQTPLGNGATKSFSRSHKGSAGSSEAKKSSSVELTVIKSAPECGTMKQDRERNKISLSERSEWEKADDDFIPDTPDPLAKYANGGVPKKKRIVGRSFLSSSSFLKVGHQGFVETVLTNKAQKPGKYNKGRNFEDAYKEMQNSLHGDKGVMGDEEAMKTIMDAMGMPQVAVTADSSEKLFQPASAGLSVAKSDCDPGDVTDKSDPKDSKLLCALDPGVANAQKTKIEKSSVLGKVDSVKRPSSGGVSPNAKRQQAENIKKTSPPLANSKGDNQKKRLFTSSVGVSSELSRTKKITKSDSWDSNVKLCENDDTLNEILGQMKTPVQERNDANIVGKRPNKSKGSPLSPIDTNVQEPKEPLLDGVDPDEALDDILKELQGTLPTNVSYIESESVLDTSLELSKMDTSFKSPERKTTKVPSPGKENTVKVPSPGKENTVKTQNTLKVVSPKHTKSSHTSEKSISSSAACSSFGRHIIIAIDRMRDHVKLEVSSDPGEQSRIVFLKGSWMDSHVKEGDIVNVIGSFSAEGVIHVTDSENYVVVHPDLLLSGTSIVSGVYCMRKSVLNERFRGYEGQNVYMLYGSLIHGLFQEVLRLNVRSLPAIRELATKIVMENKTLHDMYTLGLHENAVMEEIEKYLPQIEKFLQDQEKYKNGLVTPVLHKPLITKIADIEENIWSPRYGVKGKVDLSVQIKYKDQKAGWVQKLVPLELKTGKPSFSVEHKGQVMLYTMMMGDRGKEPDEGLLLYLKDASMASVPATFLHKKGLVQLRNEFAYHMQRTLQAFDLGEDWNGGLPPPINNSRSCAKCPHLTNCTLFNRTLENSNLAEDHPISQLASSHLQHLSPLQMSFFSHWVRLLHLEIGVTKSHGTSTKDLWCKPAELRENESQGIAGVQLDKNLSQDRANSDNRFLQTFRRNVSKGIRALQETGVSKGDQLVVSAMDLPLLALAMGSVVEVTSSTVTLSLDRDMKKYDHLSDIKYRLDKVDFHSAMATNFNNLTRLMEENTNSAKLRAVVVDKKRPEFDLTMPKGVIEKVKHIFKSLNKPQKMAILKTLMCKDYILIKGYPGTGKTSTIVSLVRILVTLGYSVLLASYTHSAVDNILLKLKKHQVDFLRLGRLARVHPDIQPYASEYQTVDSKSVEEIQNLYQTKPVIATTCLGVTHGVFSRRVFDICIVDEASQVLQPACFGPLYASKRFILVGDPLQLPPVVQSKEAREGGMAESLFARLDDTGATYELNLQYRMNKEIMRLSNELVYNGALKCGTSAVATASIQFPQPENLPETSSEWLRSAVSPQEGHEVVFLDTSKVIKDEPESKVINTQEADIALTIVQYYLKGGISKSDIGIITPYRKQVVFMRDLFNAQGHQEVEVNTVDQYQGRDKSVIIVSLVKSHGQESEILKDMRRMNVALTRAKHKLILIGAATVLKAFEPIEKLLSILRSQQIIQVEDV